VCRPQQAILCAATSIADSSGTQLVSSLFEIALLLSLVTFITLRVGWQIKEKLPDLD